MRFAARFLFLVSFFTSLAVHAEPIHGVVTDLAGRPLPRAAVSVDSPPNGAITDLSGRFVLEDMPSGHYRLNIVCFGFQAEVRDVAAGENVVIALRPALADSIVVSGIRAEEKTPVTKSDIDRSTIDRVYYGQDIPLLLRETPSIVAYTESGVGEAGYSYISLRGIAPTRINFTFDGVPLADSEDMTTYFADFPDLARSLQSIQVQRGVGTSTVGSASFGGSVNLQSVDLAQRSGTDAVVTVGSFGQRLASVGWQSGALPGGLALYARLSATESDGFRDSSGAKQRDLFFSASKQLADSQLRFTGFSGHERIQQSFDAADADTLKQNLRANPLSADDKDSFGYDLGQLQYLRSFGSSSAMTASAYYQRGYGWYDLYDDESTKTDLRRYGLDGRLLGTLVTFSYAHGPFTANYGVHVNEFRREHTSDLMVDGSVGPRDYQNYGTKDEENAFAKLSYDEARWHLYGDAQLRTAGFHYHGDVDIAPIRWTFFNPKVGARYDLATGSSVYVSAGLSTREPARSDLFQGEDNASIPYDLHAVKPERLLDLEGGWNYRTSTLSFAANVYAMEFRHEIAATGELSNLGTSLRRNVDRSYRRGLELETVWQAASKLRLRNNAAFSRNRIAHWTQFYDVYDDAGSVVGSQPITYSDVHPLLSPEVVVNQSVEYGPIARMTFAATGRYVGKSYLDNTNDNDFVTPSFFTLEGNISYALTPRARLSLQINNILNNKRVFASGYSYVYISGGALTGTSYYYPQATRNAAVTLDVKL